MDKPTSQHKWLEQLAGDWDAEAKTVMGADMSFVISKSKETAKMIGGMWLHCEARGEHAGMPEGHESVFTIGYDLKKDKYVGSFISSAMSSMWLYEGSVEGNVLTLGCKGPSWSDPSKVVDFVEELELVSPDHKRLTSKCIDDGKSIPYNTVDYHRIKH